VTDTVVAFSTQSDTLLRELERQVQEECHALIAAAERDARTIIARAHSDARGRMHESIRALRHEGRRRLLRAKAQAETEARRRAHRHALEAIRMAWPLLEAALAARWRDPDGRRAWIESAARRAANWLRDSHWSVEHPPDWSLDDARSFGGMLCERAGLEIQFSTRPGLDQGLRIGAGQALLDATPQGLLVDRITVEAALLAELGRINQ